MSTPAFSHDELVRVAKFSPDSRQKLAVAKITDSVPLVSAVKGKVNVVMGGISKKTVYPGLAGFVEKILARGVG